MYHYTGCGLQNVWLLSGYEERTTSEGEAVSIEDIDGLHQLIGRTLVENEPTLSGAEFRFLRKELGLSQQKLGAMFAITDQALARWEKKDAIPKWADLNIRFLYKDYIEGSVHVTALVDQVNKLDLQEIQDRQFKFETKWRLHNAA